MSSDNLEGLVDEIIENAFPELRGKHIRLEWKKLDDAFMQYGTFTDNDGFYIEVSDELKTAPRAVLEGGLAHELSHMIEDLKMQPGQRLRDRIAYKISQRYEALDERNTDVEIVIRGYGQQLLEFLEFTEKLGSEHSQVDGLSIRELRRLLPASPP